jgi:hypothetical protein
MEVPMTMPNITLCAPDRQKTCFACCPPIRSSGYEHIQHKNIIRRMLRENTLCFDREDRGLSPITGFSCWALGYLDKEYRRIGCLLHPFQNDGIDLRYRVDYGNKCCRESCPESRIFSCLGREAQRFWLHLAGDLDSFAYSSRKENLLFHILSWGPHLLGLIPAAEGYGRYKKQDFLEEYPFFQPNGSPRAPVYPANWVIGPENVSLLKNRDFREDFESFSSLLCSRLKQCAREPSGDTFVHRLPLDRDFLDFLRLFARIEKIDLENAVRLKSLADEEIARFRKTL